MTKLPRCPNGSRRNKKTSLCEPIKKLSTSEADKELKKMFGSEKKKRCPNGTRRNKITGFCEPTKKKN